MNNPGFLVKVIKVVKNLAFIAIGLAFGLVGLFIYRTKMNQLRQKENLEK